MGKHGGEDGKTEMRFKSKDEDAALRRVRRAECKGGCKAKKRKRRRRKVDNKGGLGKAKQSEIE